MKKILSNVVFAIVVVAITCSSCQKNVNDPGGNANVGNNSTNISPKEFKDFVVRKLVADNSSMGAENVDANLQNGWGLAISPSGLIKVNAQAVGVSGVYTLDGNIVSVPTFIPGSASSDGGKSRPTGHVFNITSDFKLPNGDPALFITASEDGSIAGWNTGNTAIRMVDNAPGAAYVGVTIASFAGNNYLYAANFAENKIDVYNKNWEKIVEQVPFNDPDLPAGYSPFNIQTIDGMLYVTYAKKNSLTGDEETGSGKGYINVFNPNGSLVKRFASGGKLNAPWGIVEAPDDFWGSGSQLTNMILVGNFGNGQISVFDENGNSMGVLHAKGKAIEIEGLWGIAFPPATSLNKNYLYFAAGPGAKQHGLMGYIKNLYLN